MVLVEEDQRGEAPVGAVELDVCFISSDSNESLCAEKIGHWKRGRNRGHEGEVDGCITFSAATM